MLSRVLFWWRDVSSRTRFVYSRRGMRDPLTCYQLIRNLYLCEFPNRSFGPRKSLETQDKAEYCGDPHQTVPRKAPCSLSIPFPPITVSSSRRFLFLAQITFKETIWMPSAREKLNPPVLLFVDHARMPLQGLWKYLRSQDF